MDKKSTNETKSKNALPFRILAVVCWVLAIGCEAMAILLFTHKVDFPFTVENPGHTIAWIGALILDLVLLIVGSSLWKKGNHLDPAPKKEKAAFWIQNNLGVIVASFAFVPFVLLAVFDKHADKKSKIISVVAALIPIALIVLILCKIIG